MPLRNFTIDYQKTSIFADDMTTFYKSGDKMPVRLVDRLGNPIAGEIISYSIGDHSYIGITDSAGWISASTNFDVGDYRITFRYSGNERYSNSSASAVLTIDKDTVTIKADITTVGDSVNINVAVSKSISGMIILTIDNVEYPLDLTGGKTSFSLNDLDLGTYKVKVRLESDSYAAQDVSTRFTITQVKTRIIVNNVTTGYGSGDKLTIKLVDRYDNPASGQIINYVISGKTYSDVTGSDGTINVDLNLDVGSYDVTIDFKGSGKYLNSSNACNVVIQTTLILPSATSYARNANYVVKSENPVRIVINNVVYDNKNPLALNLNPGTYNVVVTNKVTGEVKTQSIKMVARITQNRNIVMYYGAATYYSVKVFDDYGNVAKGVYVTFNLNGRNYNVKPTTMESLHLRLAFSLKHT